MKNKQLSPKQAIEEYIRQDICGTLVKAKNQNPRMELPNGRVNLLDIYENCLECSSFDIRQVKKCHVKSCPLYPFRNGKNNPNRKGIGNKNAYLNLKVSNSIALSMLLVYLSMLFLIALVKLEKLL